MAFRQPTFHAPQRLYTAPHDAQPPQQAASSQRLDESQEWVLFSPHAASTTDRTRSTSTERTTHFRPQLSDFGSRGTAPPTAASDAYGDGSGQTEVIDDDDDDLDAEDGELDSLDSHLPAFRADGHGVPSVTDGDDTGDHAVLPTHDGLGSFRIDRTLMSDGVQEHLYAFERFNPRRVKRRRESLELGQLELEADSQVDERTRRIEAWRLEQSRLLLEEIQKETRRRRMSLSTARHSVLGGDDDDAATMGSVDAPPELHDRSVATDDASHEMEHEGFWSRLTRKVIEDLMGIDDHLLSIIFGEALPDDDDLSTTPPAHQSTARMADLNAALARDDSWEHKVLERIARELGVLVNQLADHPGAFSTYVQTRQNLPLYAGLPSIPEAVKDAAAGSNYSLRPEPQFQPTIPISINSQRLASLRESPRPAQDAAAAAAAARLDLEREMWEKELDIKMVFRYLRSRFTSHPRPPTPTSLGTHPGQLATSSTSESAARAARVRQHHPLVNRPARPTTAAASVGERRSIRGSVAGPVSNTSPILRRRGSSSCASQSTKLSARRNSGSSRHYWDLGGSVGSGSLAIATGGMGSWGEV